MELVKAGTLGASSWQRVVGTPIKFHQLIDLAEAMVSGGGRNAQKPVRPLTEASEMCLLCGWYIGIQEFCVIIRFGFFFLLCCCGRCCISHFLRTLHNFLLLKSQCLPTSRITIMCSVKARDVCRPNKP